MLNSKRGSANSAGSISRGSDTAAALLVVSEPIASRIRDHQERRVLTPPSGGGRRSFSCPGLAASAAIRAGRHRAALAGLADDEKVVDRGPGEGGYAEPEESALTQP
ncbi:hypothetical protein Sxan_15070 [Streptomyces xanthophaeus]|uniref:Uncharacterized protein n=1 Tax=Streptomyces xanthophaeus TaxID=67385 RepID=A0A919GZT5_9ACTN|nr:hypothetical protein Sxan_15070 [Streptomyces xanthophaeus]